MATNGMPGEPMPGEPTGRDSGEVVVPAQIRNVPVVPPQTRAVPAVPPQTRGADEMPVGHRVRDELRGEVVVRHARLTGRGRPTFCSPTRAEQSGAVRLVTGRGTDGKVIYPTLEAAEAAARELEGLGARRLRPYLCARSRHGHYHLATCRPLHERIPPQRGSVAS